MLMQEPTKEMMEQWITIFNEYKPRLFPNRKSSAELLRYLEFKYPLIEQNDERLSRIVVDNVMLNECFACKIPKGKTPSARVFFIRKFGTGRLLFEKQDLIFREHNQIFVGIEIETAHIHVEGSSLLYDELYAVRGLDEDDLSNFFMVAEYVSCLKRFGMLESVLNPA